MVDANGLVFNNPLSVAPYTVEVVASGGITVDKEIMEYSTIRERNTDVVSAWEKDCVTAHPKQYWHDNKCALTSGATDPPATCYKGFRTRSRVCHADSYGECTTCPVAASPDARCDHIDLVGEGTTETQNTYPGSPHGALPACSWAQWQEWTADPCPAVLKKTVTAYRVRTRECKEQLCYVPPTDEKSSTQFSYYCDDTATIETLDFNKYCKFSLEKELVYCPSKCATCW